MNAQNLLCFRQVDELAAAHKRHNAESEALQESRSLVTSLTEQASAQAAKAVEAARTSTAETVQEFIYSACRHLYFQRAELQLLLRKLLFCAAELQGGLLVEISTPTPGVSAAL